MEERAKVRRQEVVWMGRKDLEGLSTPVGRSSCYDWPHAVATERATSLPVRSLPLCRGEDIGNGRNMAMGK